nr:hypothetical protein [Tanacetum cinerariifolium]
MQLIKPILDAYDSDCDELYTTKVALLANLSYYGSYVLTEILVLLVHPPESRFQKNFLKLIIAALKDELMKLKGKVLVNNVVTTHIIALEMLKIDVEPIAPRLLNNRTTHSDYLRITEEQAAILREVVEQGKSQNPLNNSLDSAYKYTK